MNVFVGDQYEVALTCMKFQISFLFHPGGNCSVCSTTKSAGDLMLRYKAILSAYNEIELDGETWVTMSLM